MIVKFVERNEIWTGPVECGAFGVSFFGEMLTKRLKLLVGVASGQHGSFFAVKTHQTPLLAGFSNIHQRNLVAFRQRAAQRPRWPFIFLSH
jgi:hypothetical protein